MELNRTQSIEEAGGGFLEELLRHHFGCERNITQRMVVVDDRAPVRLTNSSGEVFPP